MAAHSREALVEPASTPQPSLPGAPGQDPPDGPDAARSRRGSRGSSSPAFSSVSPERGSPRDRRGDREDSHSQDRVLQRAMGKWLEDTHNLTRRSFRYSAPYGDEGLDLDTAEKFDLAGFKRKRVNSDCSVLDIDSFGDPAYLARVAQTCQEMATRKPGVPYLHPSGIESWHPSWLGSGLPSHARRELILARSKAAPLSAAAFINSVSAYWLSHAAMGQVSIPTVLAHVLLVSRICDKHSLSFAVRYISHLQAGFHSKINNATPFDLEKALGELDIDALRLAQLEQDRDGGSRRDSVTLPLKAAPGAGNGKGKGKDKRGGPPAIPPPEDPPRKERLQVCFAHDPASKKFCPHIATCRKEHLDTTQENLRSRYTKAKSVFDRLKGKTSKLAAH